MTYMAEMSCVHLSFNPDNLCLINRIMYIYSLTPVGLRSHDRFFGLGIVSDRTKFSVAQVFPDSIESL